MGIVYRGEDHLIGREVAIKTLTEVTPELRERFYLEARSGILSHPNIVTVYELGEHDGNPFIAMEFIQGESLEKKLRLRKRLSLLESLSIVEQLCAGLGYAHGHGVVHRDVKPANVLVQPDGRVTIVDFGIARLADQTRQLTKTDALLGTFHYIAPERLKGEASDGRADVWSVGVMLYEMLTGELPFKGKDVSSLYRVIYEPYVPIGDYVQDLPEGLSNVLDKALAKDIEDRYSTAEEMAFDLQVIADALKHDRVGTLLETARRLAEELQFASARTVLLQAQRIDPGNIDTKALMNDVQDRLNHLQRGEQLRQILEQAQTALGERQWEDAITFFQQAQKLDTENAFGLEERLQEAQERKLQQLKIARLWEQASEARSQGDLTKAQDYLSQALRIDERSTDLRNAYSVILREIKRKQQALQVEELLRSARESYSARNYTETIARLREAAQIDPAHTEVQQLLFTAATRQKEERRQQLLEKIAAEIQESLDLEDFTKARDRVSRALETLPGEGLLLRLQIETESKIREFDVQQSVRKAQLEAQDLFADDPERALQAIEKGLEAAPESETLLQSKQRLQEHLKVIATNSARAEALVAAHTALGSKDYLGARRVLEAAILAHGLSEELENLLGITKAEQAKDEEKQAEIRSAAEARKLVESAVAACDEALAAGDLKRCMRALDDAAKLQGESGILANARKECEAKRERKAAQMLGDAIQAAQQCLMRKSPKEALAELRRVQPVFPFASASMQSDFNRVKSECGETAVKPETTSRPPSGLKPNRATRYLPALVIVAAAVAIAAMWHARHQAATVQKIVTVAPAPTLALTDLEINATPWAKVLLVQDEDGKNVTLPNGDLTTPLRIDGLKVGKYKVTLANPDDQQQTVECNATTADHLCTADLGATDIHQVLIGDHP
ncbi:Serine/threonine protein kinase PrkC, regulator of stationary phase [Acidisarcina polymorpha]|uniref:non-specific serine/threonine protein kinase n=2 Tax=Acidisarcina polymorpha TaxID=2211140 RepID=A0A2Z5G3S2_9BACT|nr:Serine/threonine protein kinase PrkC, regulator of stationary phase [Acidisarcina polymorpha]